MILTPTYAGIPLNVPTAELRDWVERVVQPDWVELARKYWPGSHFLPLNFQPPRPPGPVRLNRLYWPVGAACFAVGHYLVSDSRAEAIRQVVYKSSTVYVPQTLILGDGNNSITAQNMYPLPFLPLSQVPGGEGFQLLTVVDQRYFWWFKSADITVDEGTTTWEQLYAAIGSALGVTITVDTVASAYLKPSRALAACNGALPLLLDAVATSVGQRIVCGLDASVQALAPRTSLTRIKQKLLLDQHRLAGGTLALDPR